MLDDGVAQRKRQAAFRGFDVVRPNMVQAFLVFAEPETPLGLDGAGGRAFDPIDTRLHMPFGNLVERHLDRRGGSSIPVPIERHVGQTAIRRDGRWLPFGELEGRHIDRRICLRIRRNVVLDGFVHAHDKPSGQIRFIASRKDRQFPGREPDRVDCIDNDRSDIAKRERSYSTRSVILQPGRLHASGSCTTPPVPPWSRTRWGSTGRL